MGVEGVDSLGKEEVEIFTLGRLGGGATLLEVREESDVRDEGRLTPFCVGPTIQAISVHRIALVLSMPCACRSKVTLL